MVGGQETRVVSVRKAVVDRIESRTSSLKGFEEKVKEIVAGKEFGSGAVLAVGDFSTYLRHFNTRIPQPQDRDSSKSPNAMRAQAERCYGLDTAIDIAWDNHNAYAETLRTRSQTEPDYAATWGSLAGMVDDMITDHCHPHLPHTLGGIRHGDPRDSKKQRDFWKVRREAHQQLGEIIVSAVRTTSLIPR